jgi:hypothetical protein
MALLNVAIAAGLAVLAGCYRPELRDCVVTCAGEGDCADGQVCGTDGFCAAPEIAGSCGAWLDGAAGDGAPIDAPLIDGPLIDAPPTDAPLIDAPLTDAPPTDAGVVSVRVRIQGMGLVRDDAHGIVCTGDCTYELTVGTELTLTPEETDVDWHYDQWNLGACAGGPEVCVLVLSEDVNTRCRFVQ